MLLVANIGWISRVSKPVGYPRVWSSGSGFAGFNFSQKFRVRVLSGVRLPKIFGFGYVPVCKIGPKPVGFSGSGKPDPPLFYMKSNFELGTYILEATSGFWSFQTSAVKNCLTFKRLKSEDFASIFTFYNWEFFQHIDFTRNQFYWIQNPKDYQVDNFRSS